MPAFDFSQYAQNPAPRQKTAAPGQSADLAMAERLSGIESGGNLANRLHGTPMAYGAGIGGAAGLLREYLRTKSDAEKEQSVLQKALRYAGSGGLGALAGAGAGGVAGHVLSNAFTNQAGSDKLDALYKAHKEQSELSKNTNGWVPKPVPVSDMSRVIDSNSDALSGNALAKSLFGKAGSADNKQPKVISFKGEKTPPGWKNLSTAQKLYHSYTKKPLPEASAKEEKTACALEFGAMLKRSFDFNSISSGIQSGLNNAYEGAKNIYNSKGVQNFINDPTTRAGLTYGGIGAGLGGLYGAINPGEYEDSDGQVRRRGRLMGALRGAGAGGAMLGLAGAGAQEGRYQYLKNMMNQDYAANQPEYANGLQGVNRSGMQQEVENWADQNMPSMQYSPLESYYAGYNKFVNPAMQNAQRLYKHLLGSSATPATDDGELALPDPNARY